MAGADHESDGVGVVFPGQGVQRTGMAQDFHDAFAEARAVFDEAGDALHLDVARLCFEPDDRLDLTEFAQPAIVTAEVAMVRVLTGHFGLAATVHGGHSLGEYSALVAAGAVPLTDAVELVRERGRLMQAAVPAGRGSMKAVVQRGLDVEALEAALTGVAVDIANHNSPDQVVLSGLTADVDEAAGRLREVPGFERARALPLNVSAPFHSRLMAPAENAFRPLLAERAPGWNGAAAAAVTSNTTGGFHAGDADALVDALARQISAPVRWLDNMRVLVARCRRIIEVGPGKPLRAFFAALEKAGGAGTEIGVITSLDTAESTLGPPSSD